MVDFIARELARTELVRRERGKLLLLAGGGWCIDAVRHWIAELADERRV